MQASLKTDHKMCLVHEEWHRHWPPWISAGILQFSGFLLAYCQWQKWHLYQSCQSEVLWGSWCLPRYPPWTLKLPFPKSVNVLLQRPLKATSWSLLSLVSVAITGSNIADNIPLQLLERFCCNCSWRLHYSFHFSPFALSEQSWRIISHLDSEFCLHYPRVIITCLEFKGGVPSCIFPQSLNSRAPATIGGRAL